MGLAVSTMMVLSVQVLFERGGTGPRREGQPHGLRFHIKEKMIEFFILDFLFQF